MLLFAGNRHHALKNDINKVEEIKDTGTCKNCKFCNTTSKNGQLTKCDCCQRNRWAFSYRITGDHFSLKQK